METDRLIAMLARGEAPVAAGAVRRRFAATIAAGAAGALVVLASYLGVRPDFSEAARLPMFWVKLALPLALLAVALLGASRLARPGTPLGHAAAALLVPVGLMWTFACIVLVGAAPGEREAMIFGETWASCPFNIAFLSLPAFAAALWAMRGLAPTRPAVAGAFSGLLAGALGAAVYCLHCPEMAPPFLGTWYLLGMAIPAAAGALAGPRLLRW
jgi:hypothetical protein